MNLIFDTLNSLAREAVGGLLNGALAGLVLTAVAALALGRRRWLSAATRYAIWWGVLVGIITLTIIPKQLAPLPALDQPLTDAAAALPVSAITKTSIPQPVVIDGPSLSPPKARAKVSQPALGSGGLKIKPTGFQAAGQVAGPTGARSAAGRQPFTLPSGAWIIVFVATWISVAGFRLIRLLVDVVALQRVKQKAEPLPAALLARWAERLAMLRPRRSVWLGMSERVGVPMLAGLGRPCILIPTTMVGQLNETDLDGVILHEAAHLQRCDDWTNLFQRLLTALFWPLPPLWWIGQRLAEEREYACDEWVVALTGARRSYASCLSRLAELAVGRKQLLPAPSAFHSRKKMIRRIKMLLDKKRPVRPRLSWLWLGLAVGALALAIYQFSVAAPLVALAQPAQIKAGVVDKTTGGTIGQSRPGISNQTKIGTIHQSVESAVSGGIPDGVIEGVPGGIPAGVPNGVTGGVPGEVTGEAIALAANPFSRSSLDNNSVSGWSEANKTGSPQVVRPARSREKSDDDRQAASKEKQEQIEKLETELKQMQKAVEEVAKEVEDRHQNELKKLEQELDSLQIKGEHNEPLSSTQRERLRKAEEQIRQVSEQMAKEIQSKIQPMLEQIREKAEILAEINEYEIQEKISPMMKQIREKARNIKQMKREQIQKAIQEMQQEMEKLEQALEELDQEADEADEGTPIEAAMVSPVPLPSMETAPAAPLPRPYPRPAAAPKPASQAKPCASPVPPAAPSVPINAVAPLPDPPLPPPQPSPPPPPAPPAPPTPKK